MISVLVVRIDYTLCYTLNFFSNYFDPPKIMASGAKGSFSYTLIGKQVILISQFENKHGRHRAEFLVGCYVVVDSLFIVGPEVCRGSVRTLFCNAVRSIHFSFAIASLR